MIKTALKIVLGLWLIVYSLFFTTTPVLAQNSQATPSAAFQTNLPNDPRSPQFVNLYIINIIHTLSCLAEGVSVIAQPCVGFTIQQTSKDKSEVVPFSTTQPLAGGAMGTFTGFLVTMYSSPPVNTAEYIADWSQNKDLIKPVYAQVTGSGGAVLSPVFNIWKLTQQIAFIGMIIIFLVVGFMIMFRTRINPQTVISAQAALPGLVIGIILIYFSYFLSGLIVDTIFVATHLAGNILEGSVLKPEILKPGTTSKLLKEENILTLFNHFFFLDHKPITETATNTLNFLKAGIVGGIINTASILGGCYIGRSLIDAGPLGGIDKIDIKPFGVGVSLDPKKTVGCLGGAGLTTFIANTSIPGGLAGLILYVVLIIALLIAMFKILFALISAYINLIINTILAPLTFLYGSLPGKQGAITGWVKNMFAHALIFPAIFGALLFVAYILNLTNTFGISSGAGDFAGGTVPPLLGGFGSEFIKLILAYGVLLLTPTIPDMVRGAFGIKASPLGQAGLGAFMAGAGAVGAAYGRATAPLSATQAARAKKLAEERATGWLGHLQPGGTPPSLWQRVAGIIPTKRQ